MVIPMPLLFRLRQQPQIGLAANMGIALQVIQLWERKISVRPAIPEETEALHRRVTGSDLPLPHNTINASAMRGYS